MRRMVDFLTDDEDGAILPVVIMGFLLLFLMAVLIGDVGQSEKDRLAATNGTDAAAILHADVTARDLNSLTMTHVGMTQMFVVQATSANILIALMELKLRSGVTIAQIAFKASRTCPPLVHPWLVYPCFLDFARYAMPALDVISGVLRYQERYDPQGAFDTASEAIRAFDAAAAWILESHPERVGTAARELADLDRMAGIHYHPACTVGAGCEQRKSPVGGDLPVEYGDRAIRMAARAEMCLAAVVGADGFQRTKFRSHGYPDGRGPLTAAGSRRNNHARDFVSQETGLGDLYEDFYKAYPRPSFWYGTTSLPLFSDRQTAAENEFTRRFMWLWDAYCFVGVTFTVSYYGVPLTQTTPTPFKLKGQIPLAGFVPWGLGSLFARTEDFQILAVGARTVSERIGPTWLRDLSNIQYAHGQAWTYNGDVFDMYSQQWHAILTPATRMDDPTRLAEELPERAPEVFRRLHDVLTLDGRPADWGGVNAH